MNYEIDKNNAILKCRGSDKEFIIPDGVTRIDGLAFSDCTALTSVTIPNSVTSIGHEAFYNCPSLISIVIPDSVTDMDVGVFCSCTSLKSVIVSSGMARIEDGTFGKCTSLTSVTVPDSITFIEDTAFRYCHPDLTIKCNPGSYAWSWAEEHGIKTEPVMGLSGSVLEKSRPVSFETSPDNLTHVIGS